MERSDSYVAVENMIERGEIMLSDLEHLLESLHRQERISPAEREALLEHAWSKSIKSLQANSGFASGVEGASDLVQAVSGA